MQLLVTRTLGIGEGVFDYAYPHALAFAAANFSWKNVGQVRPVRQRLDWFGPDPGRQAAHNQRPPLPGAQNQVKIVETPVKHEQHACSNRTQQPLARSEE